MDTPNPNRYILLSRSVLVPMQNNKVLKLCIIFVFSWCGFVPMQNNKVLKLLLTFSKNVICFVPMQNNKVLKPQTNLSEYHCISFGE